MTYTFTIFFVLISFVLKVELAHARCPYPEYVKCCQEYHGGTVVHGTDVDRSRCRCELSAGRQFEFDPIESPAEICPSTLGLSAGLSAAVTAVTGIERAVSSLGAAGGAPLWSNAPSSCSKARR